MLQIKLKCLSQISEVHSCRRLFVLVAPSIQLPLFLVSSSLFIGFSFLLFFVSGQVLSSWGCHLNSIQVLTFPKSLHRLGRYMEVGVDIMFGLKHSATCCRHKFNSNRASFRPQLTWELLRASSFEFLLSMKVHRTEVSCL